MFCFIHTPTSVISNIIVIVHAKEETPKQDRWNFSRDSTSSSTSALSMQSSCVEENFHNAQQMRCKLININKIEGTIKNSQNPWHQRTINNPDRWHGGQSIQKLCKLNTTWLTIKQSIHAPSMLKTAMSTIHQSSKSFETPINRPTMINWTERSRFSQSESN